MKPVKTLPPLTKKQVHIIKLIYRHRFLNRTHIQQLLKHKSKQPAIRWLKDLKEKGYIHQVYDPSTLQGRITPAVYYLASPAIHFLRVTMQIPTDQLEKFYRESKRSKVFQQTCLHIADYCLAIQVASNQKKAYRYWIRSDYPMEIEDSQLFTLHPHLIFSKQESGRNSPYLLEIYKDNVPQHALRSRISQYVAYLSRRSWHDDSSVMPTVLFVFPNSKLVAYAQKRVAIEAVKHNDKELAQYIMVSTYQKIEAKGFLSSIWRRLG